MSKWQTKNLSITAKQLAKSPLSFFKISWRLPPESQKNEWVLSVQLPKVPKRKDLLMRKIYTWELLIHNKKKQIWICIFVLWSWCFSDVKTNDHYLFFDILTLARHRHLLLLYFPHFLDSIRFLSFFHSFGKELKDFSDSSEQISFKKTKSKDEWFVENRMKFNKMIRS